MFVDSRGGLSPLTASEEGLVIPLFGGQHVGTVVDAQNRHLLRVVQVLQQLVAKTSGAKVEEKKKTRAATPGRTSPKASFSHV